MYAVPVGCGVVVLIAVTAWSRSPPPPSGPDPRGSATASPGVKTPAPVRDLVENRGLARAISDAGWREPRSMSEYRCARYGGDLTVVDPFFPSTRTRADRGRVTERLPPHVRERTRVCGTVRDRDVNAARTPRAAGPAALAGGDDARPQRESFPAGRASMKQETRRATAGPSHRRGGEEVIGRTHRDFSSGHGGVVPRPLLRPGHDRSPRSGGALVPLTGPAVHLRRSDARRAANGAETEKRE
ncbi:zinc ribbon domain-containing protein [Nocardiopsis sp. N85]|uniref:zinc ribbon domain-containing protein n=1 Tax=Nocardiopsis sp. N85 TaxID=3029400 RepID=UPI00406C0D7E